MKELDIEAYFTFGSIPEQRNKSKGAGWGVRQEWREGLSG